MLLLRLNRCSAPLWGILLGLVTIGCGAEPPVPGESAARAGDSASPGGTVPVPASSRAASGDWSRFRGPSGDGVSVSEKLPTEWSLERNVAWKAPLPGPGASSPVVWGDRIFLTCFTGYANPQEPGGSLENLKRHVMAFEASNGNLLWDRAIPANLPEEASIRDHGYAANTPAVDAERVYVFLGKSGVHAFDHEGNAVWDADVGNNTSGWGTSASPLLYKDLVIINASVESESLVALDRKTGEEKWRAGGIQEAWDTPLIVTSESGRDELVIAIRGKILAFDPNRGTSLWSCDTEITWYMVPTPVAADGVVYVLGGRSGIASLAVKAGGSGDVTRSHRLWTSNKGSNVSSPVYRDGHLYWMNDQRGVAYCAKADTGEVVYEQRLDRAGQVYASALLAGGKVYYLTRDGVTYVLAAEPKFEQLAVNQLRDGTQFNGSPAVFENQLLIRSDKFLYRLGEP
jgi:outer membrane protein assembly factor BamB